MPQRFRRRSGEEFPLPWERVLWSGRPGLGGRLMRPGITYGLTGFRVVVRRAGRTLREVAVDDLTRIDLQQSRIQRLRGTSTVLLYSRLGREPLAITDIRRGPELTLILQLLADRSSAELDDELVRSALAPNAPALLRSTRTATIAAGTVALSIVLVGVGIARHDTLAPVQYPADDAIAPGGARRSQAEIIAFMEREVMPFARRALGPLKGGADRITCEICHGPDARARNWKMPGVRALPEPQLRMAGMERYGWVLDAQMRNAVYGYLAREENQHRAGYMRAVVMPGMAALLHRPPYDFTKSYGYNRSRVAFGCYHCHMVTHS